MTGFMTIVTLVFSAAAIAFSALAVYYIVRAERTWRRIEEREKRWREEDVSPHG